MLKKVIESIYSNAILNAGAKNVQIINTLLKL